MDADALDRWITGNYGMDQFCPCGDEECDGEHEEVDFEEEDDDLNDDFPFEWEYESGDEY